MGFWGEDTALATGGVLGVVVDLYTKTPDYWKARPKFRAFHYATGWSCIGYLLYKQWKTPREMSDADKERLSISFKEAAARLRAKSEQDDKA